MLWYCTLFRGKEGFGRIWPYAILRMFAQVFSMPQSVLSHFAQSLVPHIPRYPHDFHLCQQFNLIKLSALNGLEEGATVNFESLRDAGTCFVPPTLCPGYASTCIARSIAYLHVLPNEDTCGEHGFHHGLMIKMQIMLCHPSVHPLLCSYLPVRRHM